MVPSCQMASKTTTGGYPDQSGGRWDGQELGNKGESKMGNKATLKNSPKEWWRRLGGNTEKGTSEKSISQPRMKERRHAEW